MATNKEIPVNNTIYPVTEFSHTAQEIDDAVDSALGMSNSNPNLLDNWYFADPINQREVSGTITATGYFIDRWLFAVFGTGSVTLNEEGVVLTETSDNDFNVFTQRAEPSAINQLAGRKVTLSALYKGSGSGEMIHYMQFATTIFRASNLLLDGQWHVSSVTTTVPEAALDSYNEFCAISAKNCTVTVKAAKLELGDHQTLAHQDADGNWVLNDPPPNKAVELAKCQRYLWIPEPSQVFWIPLCGDGLARLTIPYPVRMRANPQCSFYVVAPDGDSPQIYVDNGTAGQDALNLSTSYNTGYLGISHLILDANL